MVDTVYFRDAQLLNTLIESQTARYEDPQLVQNVIQLDKEWKQMNNQIQQIRTKMNVIQKDIGRCFAQKEKEKAQEFVQERNKLKNHVSNLEKLLGEIVQKRNDAIGKIGNLVHKSVPRDNDEDNNELIKTVNASTQLLEIQKTCKTFLHHSEIFAKLNAFDMERGSKVAGHRGYFLKNFGVLLNQALIQHAINFLMEREYILLQTPLFVTNEIMNKCAQLQEFDTLLYKIPAENDEMTKYLIATSEQPISAYHAGEWLQTTDLPLRYAGYSVCFRKEAGSSGKDLRGIFRVHQFEKVEQFCITKPEESWDTLEKMLTISEEFLQSLGLKYRVVNIVSGELNHAASKKYDIEAWFPNTNEYRELVSCSNCTDYQSRKLGIKFGTKKKGEKAKFPHMLNCTLCATERTLCCILENYQTDDGIVIPHALRKYMGNKEFIPYQEL